ncbi:hypothetical protein PAPYR_2108 [Paratrimastix pyriformis]|uniref:Uncharacterized protein n=1 Tax=Paratrimastix pyriformis TaxID=342808 RepID=A0ABQ8UXN8_9EUKA|nr:hypothetical protein PAPYR_2108 [Paratrimastix pyriformis]
MERPCTLIGGVSMMVLGLLTAISGVVLLIFEDVRFHFLAILLCVSGCLIQTGGGILLYLHIRKRSRHPAEAPPTERQPLLSPGPTSSPGPLSPSLSIVANTPASPSLHPVSSPSPRHHFVPPPPPQTNTTTATSSFQLSPSPSPGGLPSPSVLAPTHPGETPPPPPPPGSPPPGQMAEPLETPRREFTPPHVVPFAISSAVTPTPAPDVVHTPLPQSISTRATAAPASAPRPPRTPRPAGPAGTGTPFRTPVGATTPGETFVTPSSVVPVAVHAPSEVASSPPRQPPAQLVPASPTLALATTTPTRGAGESPAVYVTPAAVMGPAALETPNRTPDDDEDPSPAASAPTVPPRALSTPFSAGPAGDVVITPAEFRTPSGDMPLPWPTVGPAADVTPADATVASPSFVTPRTFDAPADDAPALEAPAIGAAIVKAEHTTGGEE